MKNKILIRIVVYILIPALALSLPFLLWRQKEAALINAVVLDKTVPNKSYREHRGLFWLLGNLKYFNESTSYPYEYSRDYYGFHPGEGEKYDIVKLPEDIGKPDLIYITDTYGVYTEDLNRENLRGERSRAIYGGMTAAEADAVSRALGSNTLIGEFNTLASPTNAEARVMMEDMLGVKWSGWIGRYFTDLSEDNSEIPLWLIENYEMQTLEFWEFKGPGLVFVKSDDTVVVLTEGKEIGKGLNRVVFKDSYADEFKVENNVRYYYWFEVLEAVEGTEVIASYNLDLGESGRQLLSKYGVREEFPAIVRKIGSYTSYYFAGDFADSSKIPSRYNLAGLQLLNRISTLDTAGNQEYFFWRVYAPLMKKILNDIN